MLQLTGASALAAPFIRPARAATTLRLAIWDHWVPGANEVFDQLALAWGEQNSVEVIVDHITHVGAKLEVTTAAEARARTGHDAISLPTFFTSIHAGQLEPVDDLMAELSAKYGEPAELGSYLGKIDGTWRGLPTCTGWQGFAMNSRLDYYEEFAGLDLKALFPAGERDQAKIDEAWTYASFLEAAKKLDAAGHAWGNPIGATGDSQNWIGPVFHAFGSQVMDADGNITLDSDATREALAFMEELASVMPDDVYAWDDAGNNRWLISGKGSGISNSPSPWAVAKRDAPEVAEQIWHHDMPGGPNGRYIGGSPMFWGIWEFSNEKQAAKDLMLHMLQKEQQAALIQASQGYDLPPFPAFSDNPVWPESGPPAGTLYNYPPRGNETFYIAGFPAPPQVCGQIYVQGLFGNLVAQVTQGGMSHGDAIAWAAGEIEGFQKR
jgi:hypothetical protein